MSASPYVTNQEVREEAGFQHIEETASLVGVIDGSNATFMTQHKPIVDRDYNDVVDIDDVTVYVDGTPVPITSVDAATGVIILTTAPAADTEVSCYYAHSQLMDRYVENAIARATGIVHRCLKSNGIATPFVAENDNQVEYLPVIQMIVTMYAAGLALTRDYGSTADTEETSKDGYKKMTTAKAELMSLCEALLLDESIPSSGSDGNGGTVEVTNQGHVFSNLNNLDDGERQGFAGRSADSHEDFFRKG